MASRMRLALVLISFLSVVPVRAATSSKTNSSPLAGNGHNVSFDGRIYVIRRGQDDPSGGWFASVLRPERVQYDSDGFPDLNHGAFSAFTMIQPFEAGENALALCEVNSDRAPYRCDIDGNDDVGAAHDCYDFWVLESNAYANQYNGLRRRQLRLWVENPRTENALVSRWQWTGNREPLQVAGSQQDLRGIEPTVTRDGKLLVWQGHPDNDGKIDVLMYATNQTPCGAGGWEGPYNLAHMVHDPNVNGVYPLGERPLRAADGELFRDAAVNSAGGGAMQTADPFRGAYPWLFPDGEALIFTSVVIPCRGQEDPPGCNARRGGLSVIGYPTNWGVAHIDGAVNPTTEEQVRLFFSSPGPNAFSQLPVSDGVDVWPFFGSNTQSYTEIIFDDGLDGHYAGVWHMNESVTRTGELDREHTPDTSGYFNTGIVHGATFPASNHGPRGKTLRFDGSQTWIDVPHSPSLNPVHGLRIELTLRVEEEIDCNEENNYRLLVGKGNIGDGAWTIVLEESGILQGRVKVGGEQRSLLSTSALSVGQWHDVIFAYEASTGIARFWLDGMPAGEEQFPAGALDGSAHSLTIGGPGGVRDACPNGNGVFSGDIEEVRISRSARFAVEVNDNQTSSGVDAGPQIMNDGGAIDASVENGDLRHDILPPNEQRGEDEDVETNAWFTGCEAGAKPTETATLVLVAFLWLNGLRIRGRRRR